MKCKGVIARLPGQKRGVVVSENGKTMWLLDSEQAAGLTVGAEVEFDARCPVDFRDRTDAKNVEPTGFEWDVRRTRGMWVPSHRRRIEDAVEPVSCDEAGLVGIVVKLHGCLASSATGWIELRDGQRAWFAQADSGLRLDQRTRFHVGDEVTCEVHPQRPPEPCSRRQRPSYEPGGARFMLIATAVAPTGMVRLKNDLVPRSAVRVVDGRYYPKQVAKGA
jgi:hypothetical protein